MSRAQLLALVEGHMVPVPGWFTTTTPDNTEEIRRLAKSVSKSRHKSMFKDMLMSALKNGQHTIETVRLLAKKNPEAVDQAALMCALERKHDPATIEMLAEANPEAVDQAALMCALENKHGPVTIKMLVIQAKSEAVDQAALMCALERKHEPATIEMLAKANPKAVDQAALMCALENKHDPATIEMLAIKAKSDAVDRSVFMRALEMKYNTEIMDLLLAKANPEAVDQSVLKCALERKHDPVTIEMLAKANPEAVDQSVLMCALEIHDPVTIEMLAKANPEAIDQSVLMCALGRKHDPVTIKMLAVKAKSDAVDQSVLKCALEMKYKTKIMGLLLAKANPEAVDQSVLMCALENKRKPYLIELLLAKVDPDAVDQAALMCALERRHDPATIEMLAEANPEAVDTYVINAAFDHDYVDETINLLATLNPDAVADHHINKVQGNASVDLLLSLARSHLPLHQIIRCGAYVHAADAIGRLLSMSEVDPTGTDEQHLTPVNAIDNRIKEVKGAHAKLVREKRAAHKSFKDEFNFDQKQMEKKYRNQWRLVTQTKIHDDALLNLENRMAEHVGNLGKCKSRITSLIATNKDKERKTKAAREQTKKRKAKEQEGAKQVKQSSAKRPKASAGQSADLAAQLKTARQVRERINAILSRDHPHPTGSPELTSTSNAVVEKHFRDALADEVKLIWDHIFESCLEWSTAAISKIEVQIQSEKLVVELQLPTFAEIAETPALVENWTSTKKTLLKKDEQKQLYDELLLRVCLRVAHVAFAVGGSVASSGDGGGSGGGSAASTDAAITTVSLAGYVEDFALGKAERKTILACTCNAADFDADVGHPRFKPRDFFNQIIKGDFYGVSTSSTSAAATAASSAPGTINVIAVDVQPVQPKARIKRIEDDDAEFAEDDDGVADASAGTNIAGMDPDDFEQLVRIVFEKYTLKQLGLDGKDASKLQVRVAKTGTAEHRGDRGIDLVLQDLRPIIGQKIVVQAKCYTGTVGPEPVRALVTSVAEHSANKGILVTTSKFGPDAERVRDSSQGKLELLNGDELLGIMQNIGMDTHFIDCAAVRAAGLHTLERRRERGVTKGRKRKDLSGGKDNGGPADDEGAAPGGRAKGNTDAVKDDDAKSGAATPPSTHHRNGKQPRRSSKDSDSDDD